MSTLDFATPPSQASHYLKALFARKRALGAGEPLPPLAATLALSPARERIEAYRALCGFRAPGLPITLPHVLASPLHLALVTAEEFPLPAMGLLHIANQIVQHRALLEGERLALRVAIAGSREARRGLEFDLRSEVRASGELVWEGATTLLHRLESKSAAASKLASMSAPPAAMERSETWQLPAGLGRRYARVSGDFNPIHLWPLTARLFGFRRPIIHGMWTLARCAAALEREAPRFPARLEVRFKRPLALPGTALFSASARPRGHAFRVADRSGVETFLEGSWESLSA